MDINSLLQLVSGSSGSEQQDERANAPVDGSTDVGKGDGYTEGIPGPVTRLFVLANRGLSNLIQDLILVSYLDCFWDFLRLTLIRMES